MAARTATWNLKDKRETFSMKFMIAVFWPRFGFHVPFGSFKYSAHFEFSAFWLMFSFSFHIFCLHFSYIQEIFVPPKLVLTRTQPLRQPRVPRRLGGRRRRSRRRGAADLRAAAGCSEWPWRQKGVVIPTLELWEWLGEMFF